jgi:hypothetical protein
VNDANALLSVLDDGELDEQAAPELGLLAQVAGQPPRRIPQDGVEVPRLSRSSPRVPAERQVTSIEPAAG